MSDINDLVAQADKQLDKEMLRKDRVGADKYGEWAFLQNPTIDMAMDEIVDWFNYMRYTYRKLYIMKTILQAKDQERSMVQEGFVSTSALFGDRS